LHSLQRGPGADREGVRLSCRPGAAARSVVVVLGFVVVPLGAGAAGGCAGSLALDGTSASLGTHSDGALRNPAELPLDGDGYSVPSAWRARHSNYGTDELVGLLVRAARAVDRELPGGTAAVGDLSRRGGGASVEHKSHQNGRDVDVFFYAVDHAGRPVRPGEAMVRFATDGRAARWSPARGLRPPPHPVPAYRFDTRRNWAFIRALLTDPDAEVEWIFIQRALGAALIREAAAAGEDPALLARAAFIMHEPSDAEAHDDHMHVRLYCDPADRTVGCVDRGPVRWWKKLWKYMGPPYGRASDAPGATAVEALGDLIRGELPAILVGGALTS
jgi:penicillin-insensitive murein endopeptidase